MVIKLQLDGNGRALEGWRRVVIKVGG